MGCERTVSGRPLASNLLAMASNLLPFQMLMLNLWGSGTFPLQRLQKITRTPGRTAATRQRRIPKTQALPPLALALDTAKDPPKFATALAEGGAVVLAEVDGCARPTCSFFPI